jgi:hypothetical protein
MNNNVHCAIDRRDHYTHCAAADGDVKEEDVFFILMMVNISFYMRGVFRVMIITLIVPMRIEM